MSTNPNPTVPCLKLVSGGLLALLFSSLSIRAQQLDAAHAGNDQSSPKYAAKDNDQDKDQQANYRLPPGEDPNNRLLTPFLKHIAVDQKQFWSFPAHVKQKDLQWILPAAAITASLIASDSWIAKQVPDRPNQLNISRRLSDYGLFSFVAAGGGAFIVGNLSGHDHLAETGLLAGEAAVDSTLASYAVKAATRRQRPNQATGSGDFLDGGWSFPSEHAAISWSVAGVLAHEYPGPLMKFAAYGLASAVTLTRVTSRQHFASDAVIGSSLGWIFAHEVYRAHHDPESGGAAWSDYFPPDYEPRPRDPRNMGSPYVPPDNWVYPLFDRLAALGVLSTAYAGVRPWTRMECARLLEEAEEVDERIASEEEEGGGIYRELAREFDGELSRLKSAANLGVALDSVYARATEISGTPLTDGFHFAQTIFNDYGRPYSSGFNAISGFSAHAVAGPLAFALQGEYQHSPAVPPYALAVEQQIAAADSTAPVPGGRSAINRLDLLNSTVSVQFHNFQISGGKQSQWWSVAGGGPFLMSDNAEPIVAVKLDNVSPYHIPLLSRVLGDARSQYFLGRLDGHQFEFDIDHLIGPANIQPQPFLQGLKISFKPSSNLEVGFGFTAMFAGPGLPFTFRNFLRTLYAHTASPQRNPGKRISAFDFSYRVPGLRKWLTLYHDSLVVDEYSPILSSRPSLNIGLYMPQLPGIHHMDFRAEVIGTPHTREFLPGFVYFDLRRFRNGYTNDGNLLGSWIGRAGRGGEGGMTYWFTPRSSLEVGYRYEKVGRDFLNGGHLDDFRAAANIMLGKQVNLGGKLQFEHWYFPLLSALGHSNTTAQLQLTVFPHLELRK
ncbi:MAG: phosphatase PAP2 family protein [Acidobacteria bacterium]|nr:phosphatase PAP2 family protein [Acidobacteriota bacterium]